MYSNKKKKIYSKKNEMKNTVKVPVDLTEEKEVKKYSSVRKKPTTYKY